MRKKYLKLIKNSSYNTLNTIVGTLSLLILTPMYLKYLGAEGYGIVLLLAAFTGFLAMVDLGLTGAMVQRVSNLMGQNKKKEINRTINISLVIYFMLGSFLGAIVLIFSNLDFINNLFNVKDEYVNEFKMSLMIGAFNIVINMLFSVFYNIPHALQRNDIQAKASIFLSILTNLSIFTVLIITPSILSVTIVKFISSLFGFLLFYIIVKKILPFYYVRLYFEKSLFKSLFNFSAFNMIERLSNMALAHVDKILISIFFDNSFVTYYSIPLSVGQKLHSLIGTGTNVLFPFISEYRNKNSDIREPYIKVLKIVSVIVTSLFLPFVLFSDEILNIWLGKDLPLISFSVFKIILISYALFSYSYVAHFMFYGLNKAQFNALNAFLILISKIIFTLILLPLIGISGAAFGLLISSLSVFLFVTYFEMHIDLKEKFFIKTVLLKDFPVFILVYFFMDYVIKLNPNSFLELGFYSAISAGANLIIYILIYIKFEKTKKVSVQ